MRNEKGKIKHIISSLLLLPVFGSSYSAINGQKQALETIWEEI